jgi:preprotein translocase subunit SecD
MPKSLAGLLLLIAVNADVARSPLTASPPKKAAPKVEIRRAEKEAGPGLVEARVAGSDMKVYLHKDVEVSKNEIAEAFACPQGGGTWGIAVKFTKEGAQRMSKVSKEHFGKLMAIVINGQVMAAVPITSKITEHALITGDFTEEQARKIATALGPLPALLRK